MRLYGLLGMGGGGASMYLCAKCAAEGMLPWDFGTFITCNLVESGTVFTHKFTVYCAIKAFIKA